MHLDLSIFTKIYFFATVQDATNFQNQSNEKENEKSDDNLIKDEQ